MDTPQNKKTKRNALHLRLYREELADQIGQAITRDGELQPLEGVHLWGGFLHLMIFEFQIR